MSDARSDAEPSAPAATDAVADDRPPRAVWTSVEPTAPWIPESWAVTLREVVPGWASREAAQLDGGETAAWSWPSRAEPSPTPHPSPWRVIAASRRGRLHAHRGEYREDAIAVRECGDGWCGAVADGAGSAPWSRVGSAVAAHVWCETVATSSGTLEARARAASTAAYDTLTHLAAQWNIEPRALRTTLLGIVVDATHLVTVQLGDGGVVLVHADGRAHMPQAGHAGEFSGDVTMFLPDRDSGAQAAASATMRDARDIDAIMLATDGIEDPWYPLERHAPALLTSLNDGVTDERSRDIATQCGVSWQWRGDVVRATDAAAALAHWMTFEKRGENDDRSLLYAYRRR